MPGTILMQKAILTISRQEAWIEGESAELELQEGEVAYNYDEWDRELTDHRLGWCRVIEKQVKARRPQLCRRDARTAPGRDFIHSLPVPTDET